MFKAIFLLAASAALAASASLKVRPDEVKELWRGIDDEISKRLQEGEQEIHVVLGPLQEFVDSAKGRLIRDLLEASEPFYEEIAELEHIPDPAVLRCVEEGTEELKKLNESTIVAHFERYDHIAQEAQREVDTSAQVADDALRELGEIRDRVERCNEIDCAGQLEVIIVEFYNRAIKQIDEAVEHATTAALIKAPLDLDEAALDKQRYIQNVVYIGQETKYCAGYGPQPEPQPEPQPDPQPGPQPEPQPDPQPGPQPEPQPGPQPEPQPDPQPNPQPNPQPDPQPGPNPQ